MMNLMEQIKEMQNKGVNSSVELGNKLGIDFFAELAALTRLPKKHKINKHYEYLDLDKCKQYLQTLTNGHEIIEMTEKPLAVVFHYNDIKITYFVKQKGKNTIISCKVSVEQNEET